MKAKQIIIMLIVMIILMSNGFYTIAAVPYQSYNYNVWGESVPVPPTYVPSKLINAELIGIDRIGRVEDMFVDQDNRLYILDSGKGEIIVTDERFRIERKIENSELIGAAGISVSNSGTIYIAQKELGKVLVLRNDGEQINEIARPSGKGVPTDLNFKPIRVSSHNDQTIYIASEGVYEGIIEVDTNGVLIGFFGSNHVDVTLSVLTETAWKRIFSQSQRDRMKRIVPIEYSSMDMDDKGFIYAVSPQSENSMHEIKKLNPKGNNILRVRRPSDVPSGVRLNLGNYGDIEISYEGGRVVDTRFIDVAVDKYGFINALDAVRGRVFQYDQESNLIAIFGGLSNQDGTFKTPKAIETMGDKVLVLDSFHNEIWVFSPTAFSQGIREATVMFNQGLYTESEHLWREVNRQSTNYVLAYIGIGKALYNRTEYQQSMKYFQLGYDKRGYDDAYTEYRKELIRDNFIWFIFGIGFTAAFLFLLVKLFKKYRPLDRFTKSTLYLSIGYYMSSPFKASDDVRLENKGYIIHSFIIVFILFCTRILNLGLSGFLFNDVRLDFISVSREFFIVFGLYIVFILCNWAVCTLMDGEGRWRDIIIVTAYSLIPIIIANVAFLVLSNVLTLREGALLSLFTALALIYSVFLLFIGIMIIHRYTMAQTVGTMILTVIGMLMLLFLGSLLYGLFNQLMLFIGNIFTEIMFRI